MVGPDAIWSEIVAEGTSGAKQADTGVTGTSNRTFRLNLGPDVVGKRKVNPSQAAYGTAMHKILPSPIAESEFAVSAEAKR